MKLYTLVARIEHCTVNFTVNMQRNKEIVCITKLPPLFSTSGGVVGGRGIHSASFCHISSRPPGNCGNHGLSQFEFAKALRMEQV